MSREEREAKMADNKVINSKKIAKSKFMKWAKAYKGAFIINDPQLKTQLVNFK